MARIADTSNRAVSTPLATSLLLGLTAALATSIAVAGVGMASSLEPAHPFDADEPEADFDVRVMGSTAIVTHDGGDTLEAHTVYLEGDVADAPVRWHPDGEITEGDTRQVELEGDTLEVVYRDGTRETTLAELGA